MSGSWAFFILALLLGLYVLLILPHRWARRSQADDLAERRQRDERRRSLRGSHDDLEIRLLEFQREVDARVENKLQLLRGLIEEAEERIAELRALTAERESPPPPG